MAAFLLSKTNNDMTYTEGGVAKTFTQAELAAALDCMANKMLSSNENALQSPNALYNNWVANSGVRETTTK
jgi:predicted Zn-dependent peptidase